MTENADIFTSIPPRRIWLGRGAGIAALASVVRFSGFLLFQSEILDLLWGKVMVVLVLASFFIKSKPQPQFSDGVLLGAGLIGLPLFAFLALIYFFEILGFLFPSFSLLRENLYNNYQIFLAPSLIFFASIWLVFIVFCAETVFRIYRSRFFYCYLFLFLILPVLIGFLEIFLFLTSLPHD